jgi:putative NADPH-quinone reductase
LARRHALLKGFLEQTFRPGFAVAGSECKQLLKGRSARVVVTMGVPAVIYRWFFGAHSLKSLERNILKFVGIGPIREALVGMVAAKDDVERKGWLPKWRGSVLPEFEMNSRRGAVLGFEKFQISLA